MARSNGWLRHALLIACALAVVFLAAGLAATWRLARDAAWTSADLDWMPALIAFGAGSYLLRFARWHVLARRVAPRLRLRPSLRIYMAGFAMGLTPGRVGELCKFTLLRDATGVPEARSAAIFPIERATEGATFAALAIGGAVLGDLALGRLGAGAIAALIGIPTLALGGAALRLVQRRRSGGQPVGGRWLPLLLEGMRSVAGPRSLALATLCALGARVCDALLFWTAADATGLALPLTGAALAWGLAGLAGGLLLLPAGVGAVEASLVGTVAALGGDPTAALVAALLARCLTLWLWVPPGLWFAARGAVGAEAPGQLARS